jgi:hypothetical protein
MSYAFWADVIVVFHVAYVAFVVLGLLAITVGVLCKWKWARNFWFRTIHLLMIGVVAFEAMAGIQCPLTNWENDLRMAAGQPVEQASFVGQLFHKVLFLQCPDWVFAPLHIAFGVLVLLTFLLAPPRLPAWLRFRREPTPA